MKNPWNWAGPWLRCALHAHTTNSDGELAPRTLVKHYERAGYDVLAITDHWFRSAPPSTERVVVIPSAELNCLLPGDRDGHVLAFGIEDTLAEFEGERRDLAATAEWITAQGGVAYLAHPYWTGATPGRSSCPIPSRASRSSMQAASSSSAAGSPPSTGTSCSTRAAVLRDRERRQPPPGLRLRPGLDLGRSEPTVAGVLEALRTGCFYSTSGPRITSVVAGGGSVEVQCDPCSSVRVVFGVSSGAAVTPAASATATEARSSPTTTDGLITAARLDLPETAPYARVEVADARGGRAWTNPL